MAHVNSFAVRGLAGRKADVAFTLHRDVNVFYGFNGSGKSSLLKILHSAFEDDGAILGNVPFQAADVVIHSITFDQDYSCTISKQSSRTDDTEAVGRLRGKKAAPKWHWDPGIKGKWHHRYLPTSRLYVKEEASPEDTILLGQEQSPEDTLEFRFAANLTALWTSYIGEINEHVRKAQEDGLASLLKAALTDSKRNTKLPHVVASGSYERVRSFLKRHGRGIDKLLGTEETFFNRLKTNEAFERIVADLVEVERKIEVARRPIQDMETTVSNAFSNQKTVLFREDQIIVRLGDKKEISLNLLSSGEKHLLRLFVETLLAAESTLIIDEPELSLHIDWQRQLIANLRSLNPKCQLIIATHSPEILADLPDSKIFRI